MPPSGLAVGVYQPAEALPHPAVLVLHHQAFLAGGPAAEIVALEHEVVRRHEFDRNAEFAAKLLDGVVFGKGVRLRENDASP